MAKLFLYYDSFYQMIEITNRKTITIGNALSDTITIQALPIKEQIKVVPQSTDTLDVFQGETLVGTLEKSNEVRVVCGEKETSITFMYQPDSEEHDYYIGTKQEIALPNNEQKHFSLYKFTDCWYVYPEKYPIYVNGEEIKASQSLGNGDVLFCHGILYTLRDDDILTVQTTDHTLLRLPVMKKPTTVMKEKYPNYRRTPRLVYDYPDEKINFSFPSEEREDNQRGLWLIVMPPLMMLIVMGIVAMVRPRGIFILISLTMFTTTLITSTVQYFRERKRNKERNERRIRLYTRYLEEKRNELHQLSEEQRNILYFHFPSFEKMKYYTAEVSDRIWERTLLSHDFLQVRVGRANVPATYNVSTQRTDTSNQEIDDLYEQSQKLVSHYETVKDAPLVINVADGAMGMIGKRSIVKQEIEQIIGQLSFFHSYHDIRMIAIVDEEDYKNWQWMKWLPHFQLPQSYARGFIYNEQTRDQLLTSLYELLKERDLQEDKENMLYSPHFIFVVTNRHLISEHAILEYLEGEHTHLGISIIFAADSKESLTDNIHTLVRYINETDGDILIQGKKAVKIPFQLDKHGQKDNETFARTLFSLNHQLGMSQSIPETVSFLEMFDVTNAEQLDVANKWQTNESAKSLSVPIGLKGRDDVAYLNVHEKAHGPHGLLAGTTGSGKSEFLQTYILSLAVHFHPYEVAFLLIDYKGGGMAQPFKNMPHLLGTITNIEGSENFSKRALASIKSELQRRQRLFDLYEVNHINDYTELYKMEKAEEPLPHLFLISDEFAELKSEEPEFIRELVSAARIGRSLGVHLILATQKPGGVIDEQIWSNSRFKVALKVQDESDSREILKNSDASNITVTGRGYLQVGNNEVYELFQSAWSGAPYMKESVTTEDEVALVTDLGLIPLSEVSVQEDSDQGRKVTEIDAVVDEIVRTQKVLNIEKLSSPWLPPLPERIVLPSGEKEETERYCIALVDEPEKQLQTSYYYEAVEDGNIGVFGSPGYGKSFTLMTILLNFALRNSPETYQFYIFDFGNGALLPLEQLPHTGDYFRSDDVRKIEKFFSFIESEIEDRKERFRREQVSNINMYRSMSEESMPLIFIVIDNFDLVKEELSDFENKFIQLARDGQSLGIYIMLSATRTNAVRHALLSNLKTKIAHYFLDQMDKHSLIGRTEYEIEPYPGRVYIKTDEAQLAQIYLPVEGETDVELLQNIRKQVAHINETYKAAMKPISIPMLPAKLDIESFHRDYVSQEAQGRVAIGLDEHSVQPVYIDWQQQNHCLIIGEAQKGKTNTLKILLSHVLQEKCTVGLFDSLQRSLSEFATNEQVHYMQSKEHVQEWVERVESVFLEREERYRDILPTEREQNERMSPVVLIVDGMSSFQQLLDTQLQTALAKLVKNYSHLGFRMILTGMPTDFSRGFDAFTGEAKQIKHVILLMKKSDQNLIQLPYTRKEPDLEPGFGYYVVNNHVRKIQIPLFDRERVTTV